MTLTVFCLWCLIQLAVYANGQRVSQANEEKAVARITALIEDTTRNESLTNPAAKLLRLVILDCLGKCDGCINPIYYATSAGVRQTYAYINNIYDNEYADTGMSRADFIILAGVAAVRQASSLQSCATANCEIPTPKIDIKYGRTDCTTSPTDTNTMNVPSAHGDTEYVLDFFKNKFNMTARQTVAIMGVHTLGDAGIERSGFRGPWVPAPTVFDNMFYRILINSPGWYQEEINETASPAYPAARYQWTLDRGQGTESLMMLNSDVALWKHIHPGDDGEEMEMDCKMDLKACEASETAQIFMEFANSNEMFHEAFGDAFQTMTEYDSNGQLDMAVGSGTTILSAAIVLMLSLVLLALFNMSFY